MEEINESILRIKTGKAAGIDNINPEFINYDGSRARAWLMKFCSNILTNSRIATFFKKFKTLVI